MLTKLLPGLVLEEKVKPSGQRVVFYCHFSGEAANPEYVKWSKVVLKASQELNPTQIAYLQKEIDILNNLKSHFYPKLHYNNVFTEDPDTEEKFSSRLFITIEERIDAVPLSACKDRFSTEKSVIDLLIKFVVALNMLWQHDKRIVHRDLKPDNILIKENGDVVIIDLGIMREEGAAGLTQTFAPWGPCSPPYASPEQARNDKRNISFKSDFFSLGIIAYELIATSNPFITRPKISGPEVLHNVIHLEPPSLEELGKASGPFSRLLEKMMAKEPYQRFRTVDSLMNNLLEIQEVL